MTAINLKVNVGRLTLKNPILTASGTFGYGKEYADLLPIDQLGGITVKGVSPFACHGNPTPRTTELSCGLINSIGLQNPGIDRFIEHPDYLPFLRRLKTSVFVNIWGKTVKDYQEVAQRLEAEKDGIAGLEINISCPNIKEGGLSFGTDLKEAGRVVQAVREVTTLPLITKLSPNVSSISAFAQRVIDHGSDMVALINTFPAMSIDIHNRRPSLASISGGLSGPAIKPIAIKMVYDVRKTIPDSTPIIGMGGIYNAMDAIEFFLAGANAVAIGSAIFSDPQTPVNVLNGIKDYCRDHHITDINELIGAIDDRYLHT